MLTPTDKTVATCKKEWTEPGFQNKCFNLPPLDDDCQEDRREDCWRP
jgi:hypothetical protein